MGEIYEKSRPKNCAGRLKPCPERGTISKPSCYRRKCLEARGADPVANTLRNFIQEQPGRKWEGRACELLNALTDNGRNKLGGFPSSPHTLSGHLRRVATFLRKLGIEIGFYKDKRTGRRIISIRGSVCGEKQATNATGAIKPAKTERFATSAVAPEACNSPVTDDEKDLQPVISCRFEGNISIQPESLSIGGDIQRAGGWRWWEKVKRMFTRIAR